MSAHRTDHTLNVPRLCWGSALGVALPLLPHHVAGAPEACQELPPWTVPHGWWPSVLSSGS